MSSGNSDPMIVPDFGGVPAADTFKESYLRPEDAQADTDEQQSLRAIGGRTADLSPHSHAPEPAPYIIESPPQTEQERRVWSKKKRFKVVLVGALLMVAAVIGGIVGGLYAPKEDSRETTS